MSQSIESNSALIISLLVFLTVVLLLEGLYLLWRNYRGPRAKKIEMRLNALSASSKRVQSSSILKQQTLSDVPALERFLSSMPRALGLQGFIDQSGLQWTVSRLLLSCAATGIFAYLAVTAFAHQAMLTATLISIFVSAMPFLYVYAKRSSRLKKLEQQLPDAIDLIIRALRAGHAFSSGLQMIGEEMSEPIAGEFRIVHDEISFGVSLQHALAGLSKRVPITDLRYFVVAVLIQRESGGNLTEVLGNLSRLIRDRLKLFAKVRVLSSEGRLSAWVLGVMPFVLAAVMNLVNPDFMSLLWTDPIGTAIIKYMLTLMVIGVLILRNIIKIRV
ncbi:type II secretion system F family protein [Noviherbaspirillum sp. Root189]|uniref:type II secretion system F family protein n=1 Tax=Noviherbaspirillum sp. Root189 TaxID=1736487 RepID=UPI00070B2ACE|nr:type II secretion system F family protein [Noviherbaspirillum sp. Root189]KRB87024.1 pilus assembly protein TadB [Noviherbaspirillum sp. Root189]